jgi:zinc transport system substrate-binding protein
MPGEPFGKPPAEKGTVPFFSATIAAIVLAKKRDSPRRFSQFAWVSCLAAFVVAWLGCDHAPATQSGKPVIAVSIFPVANLVEQLTDGWAEVATLLPASASPHDVEITPDQMRQVARADLLVVVGMGLDPWAEKAAEAADSTRIQVLRFSDLIAASGTTSPSENHLGRGGQSPFVPDHLATVPAPQKGTVPAGSRAAKEDARNPRPQNNHLWLDPVLTIKFVEALSRRLKERYSEHAAAIQAAADKLLADLHQLDREYAEQLGAVRKILVRLTDIELTPGGEVTPDRIREALEAMQKYKLKVLYAETEFPDQIIQRLHDETGVQVLTLDPQGNPAVDGYRTYQEMMRSNLKTLVKGQSE